MIFVFTDWIERKGGYIYNQSTEIEHFERTLPERVMGGAGSSMSGFCLTAALYWIKCLKKRPQLAMGHDKDLLVAKRGKIYATQKEALGANHELREQGIQLLKEKDAFLERVRALDAMKLKISKTEFEQTRQELQTQAEKLQGRAALHTKTTESRITRIGNATIQKAYVDVAAKYKLALYQGEKGKFDSDGDVGADIAQRLAPGRYYLLIFSDSAGSGEDSASHAVAISVSYGGWLDRAHPRPASEEQMPSRMYLFDPNLGNFGCGFAKSGARFLKEFFMSYRDHTREELQFDEWSLFAVH